MTRSTTEVGSGLVVVDKPAGWTSHQVVGKVRRILGTRKVGHAGTLDPMATGVLLVGVNKATRLLGHLMLTRKSYTGTVRLGETTITDDAEGETTATADAGNVTRDLIAAALTGFRGDIVQVPSAVSAIKVDGRRSYARVRAGEQVDLAARPVTVHRLALTDVRPVTLEGRTAIDVDVEVDCSSGTYIRALARDLGAALGVGGHLTRLRRTAVGPYGLDRAQQVGADTAVLALIEISAVARDNFTCVQLDAEDAAAVRHGRRVHLGREGTAGVGDSLTAVFDHDTFLALCRPDGRPAAVYC